MYNAERYRNLHCDFLAFDIVRSFADSCRNNILYSCIQADYIKTMVVGVIPTTLTNTKTDLLHNCTKTQTTQSVFVISQRTKSDGR